MTFVIARKTISLLLAALVLFLMSLALYSCADNSNTDDDNGTQDGETQDGDDESYLSKVIVPPYKEYEGRDTVKFSEIEYVRPNYTNLIYAFDDIEYLIDKNKVSFEEQIKAIQDVETAYFNELTMFNVAYLYNSANTADTKWSEEFKHVSTERPAYIKAVEDMYVAAAKSEHKERFEAEYFGEDTLDEYVSGGKYSEELVKRMKDEAALENEFTALSPSTLKITFGGQTDIVANIIGFYRNKYGAGSAEFQSVYNSCMTIYTNKYNEKSQEILVNLIKVRKLIAGELGMTSYEEHAYDNLGHDYTPQDMSSYVDEIKEYVVPVYYQLYNDVLFYYFSLTRSSELTLDNLLNNTYHILKDTDSELYDIYCFMLQYGLFDIQLAADGRFDGAFTTYLYDYDAPFIFMTADGRAIDYTTLFHEFGHFTDSFINYNSTASLDLSEISSQALELLMSDKLGVYVPQEDKTYINYLSLTNAMQTLIYQGFYTKFETLAYQLPYQDINADNLTQIVETIASDFGFDSEIINRLYYVINTHTVTMPFYVQSYATSIGPSLELYFMEKEKAGTGFATYKALLNRGANASFLENLQRVGLKNPFEDDYLKELMNDVYYDIVHKDYTSENYGNAA